MKKVYVVVENEVIGYLEYSRTPAVFANKSDALEFFNKRWKDSLDEYEDEEWETDEGVNWKEIYEDGSYCENHYKITLHELEVL